VLKGSLRVQKLTDNGHEIVLYHVGPGQSCRLTNSCLLGGQRYPAEAYTETEVELLSVPKAAFRQLLDKSSALREEIFTSIDDAMGDLVRLVEDIAFGQLDHRLAQFLLSHARQQSRLEITHQELATELGTAREVISRLLKEFERNGWVKLHRGSVEINERESLAGI
jgi:CRP/FNR family transcriptional regulator